MILGKIPDKYDVAQIYVNGELAADNFYYGKEWRVPAKLLHGKECYFDFCLFKSIPHIMTAEKKTMIRYHKFSRQKP